MKLFSCCIYCDLHSLREIWHGGCTLGMYIRQMKWQCGNLFLVEII